MAYTEHQIACVRKFCNDFAHGVDGWKGCTFPVGCIGYSPCKPEIDGGLALAESTPLPQERPAPTSPPAEQLQGAHAPTTPMTPKGLPTP